MGWNTNHKGGDREYKNAEEFILASKEIQETANRQKKSLEKKVNDLEREIKHGINALQKHNQKVYEVQVQQLKGRIKELQSRRKEAVEDGDNAAVSQIDEQIQQINKIPDELPAEDLQIEPPGFAEWREENPWYKSDPDMTKYADYQGANNPAIAALPFDKMLKEVAKLVREKFPEKFENDAAPPKDKEPPVSPVESASHTRKKAAGKLKYTYNDLSDEQKSIYNMVVKRGIMTGEDYIKQLQEIEANSGRV
jgi:hypothetical protein